MKHKPAPPEIDQCNLTVVSPAFCTITIPEEVCGKGQHTGNPHCDVIDTPDPSVVPLPAAAWLFITAIVALVGVKRLKR